MLTLVDEDRFKVDGWNESKEFKVLMKDLDAFLLLKIFSTFLSFSFSERRLILFFKQMIFFLVSSKFLKLEHLKVEVANVGNSDESRWNLDEDVDLETMLGDEEEEEMPKNKEVLFFSEGKAFWVGGALQGLLLGLKTFSDFAFDAKVDAIINARLDFFFLWQVSNDWGDDGVTMLVLTPKTWFFLNRTSLGVLKLDGLLILRQVSEWKEAVSKVEGSIDGKDVSFDGKEVSSIDACDGERILGSSSFNLFKASRRMEEECMLQSKKLFSFIKSSCEEWGIRFLNDEALSISLRMDLWLLKEGAMRIIFKTLWREEFFLEGVETSDRDKDEDLSFLVSSCGK